MSKFRGPNQWGKSGVVAGEVFYTQFGQTLSRGEPREYLDANTELQQNTRVAKFTPAVAFARAIKYKAKEFFQRKPATKTAFSTLLSILMNAFGGTVAIPTFSPSNKIVGNGDIPLQGFLTAVKLTLVSITLTWNDAIVSPFQKATDVLGVLVYPIEADMVVFIQTPAIRSAATYALVLPDEFSGRTVYVSSPVWVSADGKLKSPFYLSDPIGPVVLT